MERKCRIMHGLSEVAGQNAYSVQGIKRLGENAETVLYYKHPFAYKYDRCLNFDKSKRVLFPYYALKLLVFYIEAMFRYNIFHFHYGHSILDGVELWTYSLFRKKIFFEFHGSDLRDYKKACEVMGMTYDEREATSPQIHRRNKKICLKANGIIVHDDELISYLPRVKNEVYVVPLRVDIDQFKPCYPNKDNKHIRIVHAPSKREVKGTKYILEALEGLVKRYDNIEFVLVEGKTQQEAFEIYKTADIIIDQLFVGTYGVFSIESMALGKPVITYISEEMKQCLPEELPIVSAGAQTITGALEMLINNPELRNEKGKQGRLYVENYHDYRVIAHILKDIYEGRGKVLSGRDAFRQVRELRHTLRIK